MDRVARRLPGVSAFAALIALIGGTLVLDARRVLASEEAAIAELPAPSVPPVADPPAVADVPFPPLHLEIDRLIAAAPSDPAAPRYEQIAAPLSSDGEFLRRVSLDLTGQIPPVAETRAFLADADPAKREKLVDRLLASPAYPRHMQRTVDLMLMRRLVQKHVPVAEWETFLRQSFAANKPWDQLVREILAADGTDPKTRAAARFVLDRDGDSHQITRDVGKVFLGANIECAQCHDHPVINDFKQAHYYGLQAYLVRTFLFTDEKKVAMLAEKADGETSFESVFEIRDKKSSGPKSAPPNLFAAVSLAEPKFEKGQAYVVPPDDKKKTVRPIPKFSRRSQLPDALTSPANRRFARTAVNRFWAVLLGRGLVHPLDQDHADNPPSHPDLLEQMTDDFLQHGYDVKWLLREIVLSTAYQRSSVRPASAEGKAVLPAEDRFAQALLRPLSPAQFAASLCQATGETELQRQSLGNKLTEEALHQRLAGYETPFLNLFGGQPGKPPEGLEPTVDQSLWLANNSLVLSLLNVGAGSLTDRLLKLPADNPAAIAEELYLSVLVRPPTEVEVQEVAEFLKDAAGDARAPAVKDLVWAVAMSAEFRFVH